MLKLKYFLQENKMLIVIISIILICSIAIAIGVYAQITNRGFTGNKNDNETDTNYEDLKNNFEDIFTNNINKEATAKLNINYDELLYCRYNIKEEKSGKYNIDAKIPEFKGESEVIQNINKEIYDTFAGEIIKIANTATVYTTYNLDYVAYVNNNVISLVIMCKYKNGTNPQRRIVQTYNYDIEKDKLLNIEDIINYKSLNKEEIEKTVQEEIKKVNNQMKNINNQGYNVYLRDEDSEIYKIENTSNFFLGKNNYLYLVYAYGNNNYTSEMDLVIF